MKNIYIITEIITNNDKLSNFVINKSVFKKQYIYALFNNRHKRLFKHIAKLDDKIITATANTTLDLFKILLRYVNIDKNIFRYNMRNSYYSYYFNITSIIYSCATGHLSIFKLLSNDKRVNTLEYNQTAIILASNCGHLEIVRFLLTDDRVDLRAVNNLSIIFASEFEHLEIIRLLLANIPVISKKINDRAIQLAYDNKHHEICKLLNNHPSI